MIILEGAWQALCAEAARAWPEECCGLLVGPGRSDGVVTRALPLANVHPERRRGFALDERAHAGALRAAERAGEAARAIFHSHPEGAAALSAEDERGLLLEGQPLFPGVALLVLATRGRRVAEAALFCFDAARGAYLRGDLRRG